MGTNDGWRIGEAVCVAWVVGIFALYLLQFRSIIEAILRQMKPSSDKLCHLTAVAAIIVPAGSQLSSPAGPAPVA
jgi:hypothetical protein